MGNPSRIAGCWLLCGLLAGCASGAQPCFPTPSLVTDLRVLAVRDDPPETIADLSSNTDQPPIALSALLAIGVPGSLEEYGTAPQATDLRTVIRICLIPSVSDVNGEPGCPAGSLQLADLPAVPDVSTPYIFSPPVSLLKQALEQDPLHGLGGLSLLVQLDFSGAMGSVSASKILHFLLPGSPETLNHGLNLAGFETSTGGVHKFYDLGDAVDILVARTTGLRPLISPGAGGSSAVETYIAYDNHGDLQTFTEHVTYAFYGGSAIYFGQLTNGTIIYTGAAGDEADEPPAGTADPPNGLVSVEATYPGDQSGKFWVVARDDRGAVTWAEVPYVAKSCGGCPINFFGCN